MPDDGFDFKPGAQIPLPGSAGETAATQALASAAYRDSSIQEILKADNEWHKSTVGKGRIPLLEPNLGEAFARAVQLRMLGAARKPLIQSFGMEPQTVVEHCLAAIRIRKERDTRLTVIMAVFGVLFLPGLLLWLGVFQLRRTMAGSSDRRAGAIGTGVLIAAGVLAVVLLLKLPLNGLLGWYIRGMIVAPVLGWFWAKQICEVTAKDLRLRWESLLSGGSVGAKVPEAVPQHPNDKQAENLRQNLVKLTEEQRSNNVFYAGTKGILGMGTRWGGWNLAEDLEARPGTAEIHPFRSWDVVRAIHDQLRMLERNTLHTGGFPKASIRHWVATHVGAGAGEVARMEGPNVDGYVVRPHEIQRICDTQQFDAGNRHYLGVQYTLYGGQLINTMLITVTVLHKTLRIEVTGHALGPVHGLFTTKPAPKTKTVSKPVRFWETKDIPLPLIDAQEVVRLAVRAPFTWYPPLLDFLGGKLVLPEPFGLRHAWAAQPWANRFMTDDLLRAATPVLRVVHQAALKILAENGVDTERFGNRSMILSGMVQDAAPRKADLYDA